MSQFKKPRTFAATFRADTRSIATIAEYWRNQGYQNLNVSELARISLELLAELLISNNLAPEYKSTAEAFEYLSIVGLHKGTKRTNFKNLVKQIELETMQEANECTDDFVAGLQERTSRDKEELDEMKRVVRDRLKQQR